MLKLYQFILGFALLGSPVFLMGQGLSNVTDVNLTFTPMGGGSAITASANDPDGDGPMPFQVGNLSLSESTEYTLTIDVQNTIDGVNHTTTIQQNSDDYLFFFSFTDSLLTSPAGDGNIDNRLDPISYRDEDANGLPIGLTTYWETECTEATLPGSFQIILKHQPGMKSASSTINDGTTEFDISWGLNVNEDPDAPPCENEEEIITDVTLTFTPTGGGTAVTATAQDPDGPGPLPLQITQDIELTESTAYEMSITLFNSIEGEDITEEIMEEADEHMFFFAFTDSVFTSPAGNGNVDNRPDPVNYNDFDGNNLPVGLSTNWTTKTAMTNGTFRVVLKHQPDIKSETSTINDGGTDVDLTWNFGTILTSSEDLDLPNKALKLAPNPVSTTLNWRLEDNSTSEKEMIIYDQFGRTLHLQKLQHVNGWTSLEVGALPNGIYYVQIRSAEKNWIQRFIKTN